MLALSTEQHPDVRGKMMALRIRTSRAQLKFEVDMVIENAVGKLVCVEVKAAATVKASDLRGLKKLASVAGDQFKMGVLLYDGTETLPLGDGIWAAPLSTLWGSADRPAVPSYRG